MAQQTPYHKPVLVKEVLHYLNIRPGKLYVDVTFGGGGHTRAILEYEPTCSVVAIDWDKRALELNGEPLQEEFSDRLTLVWGNFAHLLFLLKKIRISAVDGILADFGTSQFQIKEAAGFSVYHDTSLDMRMSPAHQKVTAAEVINKASEKKLLEIFWTYGEERNARKIVAAILEERTKRLIKTTGDLVDVIERVVPARKDKKIHPATKVFQALRIYVNNELGNITSFLNASRQLLNSEGRLVCISFHSLEDRLVKQFLREHASNHKPGFEILTSHIVKATEHELTINPSARSACLRAAQMHR